MRRTGWLLVALALTAGCGDDDGAASQDPRDAWPSVQERTLAPDRHATPYTAAQIRRGCPDGRTVDLRMSVNGADQRARWTFSGGDEKGCTVRRVALDADGLPTGMPSERRSTWRSLQRHASWPVLETKVTEERVQVGAGTFDCMLYTVTSTSKAVDGAPGVETISKYWFAWSLPGPPVKVETTRSGKVVSDMEMLANRVP